MRYPTRIEGGPVGRLRGGDDSRFTPCARCRFLVRTRIGSVPGLSPGERILVGIGNGPGGETRPRRVAKHVLEGREAHREVDRTLERPIVAEQLRQAFLEIAEEKDPSQDAA